jgi:hypothetical protein
VTAWFFGFHPSFVARALPAIWSLATPAAALQARLVGIDAATRRVFPEPSWQVTFTAAVELLGGALSDCSALGRPLFGANRDLPWPTGPNLALWHASTLFRELRGDGHVVALVASGLDPCQAHITKALADGMPVDAVQPHRGWDTEDWQAACEGLQAADSPMGRDFSHLRGGNVAKTSRLTPIGSPPKCLADWDRSGARVWWICLVR